LPYFDATVGCVLMRQLAVKVAQVDEHRQYIVLAADDGHVVLNRAKPCSHLSVVLRQSCLQCCHPCTV